MQTTVAQELEQIQQPPNLGTPSPWQPDRRDYENEKSITGKVKKIIYSNASFTVGVLYVTDGPAMDAECKFVAKDSSPELGSTITLNGSWTQGKFGWQFDVASVTYPAPDMSSVEGLAGYIKNMDGSDGIGPVRAKKIAEAFAGEDFDKIIREQPERIAEVAKLKIEQVLSLRDTWCEHADTNAISVWLMSYGLTPGQIRKIAREFGNRAKQILTTNPYVIHERIDGIGFLRNDEIALKMGVDKNDCARLRAGILYFLNEAAESTGHTYIERDELVSLVVTKLYLDNLDARKQVNEQISELCGDSFGAKLVSVERENANSITVAYVGASWLRTQELYILDKLTSENTQRPKPIESNDISDTTPLDSLTDEQRGAAIRALTQPISIITGGAGTGKSHTISRIKEVLIAAEQTVAVAAPTGKAARRLQQDGIYAQTIHKLLEYSPATQRFMRDEEDPLEASCVIIDEVSMCAIPLLWSLCKAIDFTRTRLILVGDYNQLPPIGPGNTLRDYVDNEIVPVTRLTQCHRNAGELKTACSEVLNCRVRREEKLIDKTIKPDCPILSRLDENTPAWSVISSCEDRAATENNPLQSGTEQVISLLCLLQREQFAAWGFDPLRDCQVITPQNPGPLGVNRINLELQRVEQAKRGVDLPPVANPNARPKLLVGDKVMQIKNDYGVANGTGLMNGTQGVILDIVSEEDPKNALKMVESYVIQFDDRDTPIKLLTNDPESESLVLAYAVTVHKVQGSQYPCVASVVHRTHSYMLSRNLLYTAVTRARYTSIILGEDIGINRAAREITNMNRRTWTRLEWGGAK